MQPGQPVAEGDLDSRRVLTRPIAYTSSTPYGATTYKYPSVNRTPTAIPATPATVFPEPEKPSPKSPHPLVMPCACEFLGTFVLVYTIACCPAGEWFPTACAAIYIALVYTVGLISGAHLNPAISLSAVVARKMPYSTFFSYFMSQIAGGALGALFFRLCFPSAALPLPIAPVAPYHFGEAALIEVTYTTMLAFVALNVTTSSSLQRNQFFGLAVGFVIIAGGYASLHISGALFNPALSFGLGLCSFRLGSLFSGCWYALVELGGGIIAAFLFRICRHNEYSIAHELIYEVEGGEYVHPHEVTIIPVPGLPARVFSEFLGTFWVVLSFGLNTVLATGAIAWSVAGAFISMTYALGSVSGAHFNPAVTVAIMLSGRGKCPKKEGAWFILAQLVAAIPSGLIFASAIPKLWDGVKIIGHTTSLTDMGLHYQYHHYQYNHYHAGQSNTTTYNITGLTDIGLFAGYTRYNWYEVALVEFIFTFLLAYVFLVVATSEMHTIAVSKSWPNFYFALAIGLAVAGVVYAAGPVSGGYLNPAVALGFAVEGEPSFDTSADIESWPWLANLLIRFITGLVKGIKYYAQVFWYILPEILGACFAALAFRVTHATEYSKKDTTNAAQM